MKISIDARGVNLYKGSGIGTYIENLLRELLNIDKKNTYSIFWAGENYNEFKKNNSKIIFTSKRHGGFYENYYYPSFIKNNNIDNNAINNLNDKILVKSVILFSSLLFIRIYLC